MPGYSSRKSRTKKDSWKIWAWTAGLIIWIPVLIAALWFYKNIIRDLPDISEIENFSFKQATLITDKNWVTLYKLFEENRDYIPYENISPYFVDAIIATEDQRFWENPGVDRKGTLRAWITDVLYWKMQWWSTITQQLIKNVMLSPEKKIERKLKEIILAMKVSKYIKNDIKNKYNNLSQKELDRKVKEKIMELYSNLIFFGNNSYGIEIASQTYFAKSASDLTILEAAILAGLPQAPSTYNPYTNRALLMGELQVTDVGGTPAEVPEELQNAINERIKKSIDNSNFTFKRDDTAIIEFFKWLLSFKITQWGQTYQINYRPGRKDSVLARMYEEENITESEFKKNFYDGLEYEFKRGSIQIKAPHFVFWVINMLEENYDQEILREEGLTIKTTLDYSVQKMAEQSIDENRDHISAYQAWNASLLYFDSQNWDVLAYVGSKDYHNDDIDGQVDIIQSKRQPGSTVKPFVYALGFMKLALTIDSPIYDIKFTIANNTPENADGWYNWIVALKNALAWSRNIPAIKMFLAVWWEVPFKNFLQSLGVNSLVMDREIYGYPLSIGAGEMTMLELGESYAHLSTMGKPAEINPIAEIRSSDWSILYKKQVKLKEQVVPGGVAYIIWDMLSNKSNFPSWWVKNFTYPGIAFATKSWTTNVVKGTEKLPRDAWLVNYTPSKVIINWAWNTDWSALRKDAFGWWLNSPIRKTFVTKLDENSYIQDERPAQMEVAPVTISNISWKLATENTPLAFTKKSLGYLKTLPTQVDTNVETIKVDSLCGKLPSELTPADDIKNAYFIRPESILPDNRDRADILNRRETTGKNRFAEQLDTDITLKQLEGICDERNLIAELGEISINIMQPVQGQKVSREFTFWHQTKSPFKITSMKLFLWSIELDSFAYNRSWNLIDINTLKIPAEIPAGTYPLKAVIVDEKWYSDSKTLTIELIDNDVTPPYLLTDKIQVEKTASWNFDVVLLFADDEGTIAGWSISQNDEEVYAIEKNVANFEVATLGTFDYTVKDNSGNEKTSTITLSE